MLQPFRFPQGSRVVHIGPHKTGTTAVQFAFHEARDAIAEHGVHYVGPSSQIYLPALGLTGLPGRLGGPRGSEADWQEVVDEVRAAGARTTVMSSESLANAEPPHIARLAGDLDPDRLQVVRMVRRYDKMLPSQWQQQVSGGARRGYRSYLDRVLADPGHGFWSRHGFIPLTRTWLEQVGPEHLTVVVVNEDDRGWLLRVFEQFVGLPTGTLQPPAARENRSLTRSEVEVLRELNRIRHESGWVGKAHFQYVRRGVSVALRELPVDPQGGRIALPPSLVDEVAERNRADVEALVDLGVRVVGSTDWLHPEVAPDPATRPASRPSVSLASAEAAVGAVLDQALEAEPFALTETEPEGPFRPPVPDPTPPQKLRLPDVEPVPPRSRVRLVPGGPAAAALLADLPPAKKYSSFLSQGRTLHLDGAPTPSRRSLELLVLVPPHEELLFGWQQHLLQRGADPLEDWLAAQPSGDGGTLVREVGDARRGDRGVQVLLVSLRRSRLLRRQLARLLDLPPRRLKPTAEARHRRALLDPGELELVRRLNDRAWDDAAVRRYVHRGAVSWLREGVRSDDDDGVVAGLPVALQDRASQEATALLAALADTGVTVVGDPGMLLPPSPTAGETRLDPERVALAVAGALARTDPRLPVHGDVLDFRDGVPAPGD